MSFEVSVRHNIAAVSHTYAKIRSRHCTILNRLIFLLDIEDSKWSIMTSVIVPTVASSTINGPDFNTTKVSNDDGNRGGNGEPSSKEVKDEVSANKHLNIGVFDLWAAGLAIVIGGQYFSWNFALAAGFGSCFITVLLVGLAYICLCLCNAEMSSCLLLQEERMG